MKINQAIRHALDGEALLFIGSGFSFGAKNIEGSKFSTGEELAKELCESLKIDEPLQLNTASGIYLEEEGADKLIQLLHKKYTAVSVTQHHEQCASIPWRRVYTTNYDNVFELSAQKTKKKYLPIELSANTKYHLDKNNICLHINGYIDNLSPKTLNEEFKLTTHSYLTESFKRSKWSTAFRQDINLAKAIVFIGYSMYDLDIARIVGAVDDIKEKCIFITGPNPKISEKHTIKGLGRLAPIGLNGFCEKVLETQKNYDPSNKEIVLKSLEEYKINETDKLPDDRNRYDLLLRGDLNKDLLFTSLFSTNREYTVDRTLTDSFFEKNKEGINKFLIYGSLGNGKTILTEQICCKAIRLGWRVFSIKDFDKYAISDLSDISKLEGKILIVVENYSRHLDFVKQLLLRSYDKITIVFTERTGINEFYFEELLEQTENEKIYEINCDKLTDREIESAMSILDSSALWDNKKVLGYIQKKKHITRKLNREFQGILLDILNSPEIKKRLNASLDQITPDSDTFKVIALSLILKALNYTPSMVALSELLDVDNPKKLLSGEKAALSEIFSLHGNSIEVKSSVLSNFLLNNMLPPAFTAEVMSYAYRKCDDLNDLDATYKSIQRDLRRYSVLQSLLPEENRRSILLNYYEEIKNLPSSKTNPFFWVQYGIARLTYKDFEIATQCFAKAYAIGENSDRFDGYQIDNHYARLLIEKSIFDAQPAKPIELFKEAHTLLSKQAGNASKNKHYPYRVASLYKDFFTLYRDKLETREIEYIRTASATILRLARNIPAQLRENKYVQNCISDLNYIMGESESLEVS